MRNRRSAKTVKMFKAHLEYIYHITCQSCKSYFTYATMNKKECIDRGHWYCPRCGLKGVIEIEPSIDE